MNASEYLLTFTFDANEDPAWVSLAGSALPNPSFRVREVLTFEDSDKIYAGLEAEYQAGILQQGG